MSLKFKASVKGTAKRMKRQTRTLVKKNTCKNTYLLKGTGTRKFSKKS